MTHPAIAAESELRRLAAENAYLKTGYDASRLEVESLKHRVDEVGRIARENRSRAIVDLEAQISKRDFTIECYEKDLDTIKAALPADKYPGSKDWREGSTLERIQWLHDYYQGGREEIERLTIDVLNLQAMLAKANNQAEHFERHWYLRGDEIESLQAMLDAVGAGGVEPLRRGKCLHQIAEPEQKPVLWQYRWKDTRPQTVTTGQWYEWRSLHSLHGQSGEDKLRDIRAYIADGKPYELRALYTHPAPELSAESPELSADVYQHKSGGLYRIVCEATDFPMQNPQVVYRNIETGECWVRPKSEFEDGRFKRVPAEHVVDANKTIGSPSRWLTTV